MPYFFIANTKKCMFLRGVRLAKRRAECTKRLKNKGKSDDGSDSEPVVLAVVADAAAAEVTEPAAVAADLSAAPSDGLRWIADGTTKTSRLRALL